MIATLAAWTFATAICHALGLAARRGLARLWGTEDDPALPFAIQALLGMAVAGTFLAGLSFFLPIAKAAVLLLAGLAGLSAVACREALSRDFAHRRRVLRESPPETGLLFAAGLALLLWSATLTPAWFDSAGYHTPVIRWAEEHPVVPGLANLHRNFGFNSHYTLLCAAFGFSFLGQPLHGLGGLLLVWILSYGLPGFSAAIRRTAGTDAWGRLLLAAALLARFTSHSASPLPDLATAILIGTAFAGMVEAPAARAPALAALLLFVPAIKLNGVGALFFLPLLLARVDGVRWPRRLGAAALLGALFMIPWIGRSWVLTGYPLYPASVFAVLEPDWKVPLETVQELTRFIRNCAKFRDLPAEPLTDLPIHRWVPIWFGGLSWPGKAMIAGLALLPLVALLRRPRRPGMWAAAYGGAGYWFLSAPDTRFGFPYLLVLLLLLATALLPELARRGPRLLSRGTALAGAAALLLFCASLFHRRPDAGGLLLPAPYPDIAVEAVPIVGGTALKPIRGTLVWYAPLPASNGIDSSLERRGDSLSQGFRIRP